jgi:RsiW-degrading membrane proteinase PrsW (M82 family)
LFAVEKILFSFLPIPLSILLYQRYFFKEKLRLGTYLDAFLYGILQAAVLLLVFPWLDNLLQTDKKFLTGFINAALLEKFSAFGVLLYLFSKQYKKLRLEQYIFFGMFLGIGFSALENIFYSLQVSSSMIVLRLFSSVPLHLTTCGMIGYFLGRRHYHQSSFERNFNLFLAIILPFLFHGAYDTALLYGDKYTYLIGPELVFLILVLEYFIAKGIATPSFAELAEQNIYLEDYKTIELQPQYERWIIRSMGKKNAEFVDFFLFHVSKIRASFIFILVFITLIFFFYQTKIIEYYDLKLTEHEQLTLFFIYPAVLAMNLFLLGAINPEYFKNSIIRIPIIMEVNILNGADVKSLIASEITFFNSFLKSFDTLGVGHELEITYTYSDYTSPPIRGKIVWENHENFERPMGSLLQFNSPLSKEFINFLIRYYLYKLGKGILYNIRFPGFEKIRKLFVKESTVMEADNYYTAGTILFKEGDKGSTFYLLKKGNVEICKYLNSGEKISITIVESGQIFGEMSILGNQPRSATAVCMTNSVVAKADGENLNALIKGNPDFSLKLIQTLANRIGSSENLLKTKIDELELEVKKYKEELEFFKQINPNEIETQFSSINTKKKSKKATKPRKKRKN